MVFEVRAVGGGGDLLQVLGVLDRERRGRRIGGNAGPVHEDVVGVRAVAGGDAGTGFEFHAGVGALAAESKSGAQARLVRRDRGTRRTGGGRRGWRGSGGRSAVCQPSPWSGVRPRPEERGHAGLEEGEVVAPPRGLKSSWAWRLTLSGSPVTSSRSGKLTGLVAVARVATMSPEQSRPARSWVPPSSTKTPEILGAVRGGPLT